MDILVSEMSFPKGDHLWLEDTRLDEYYKDNICNGCGSVMTVFSQVVNNDEAVGLETSLCSQCGFTKRTKSLLPESFSGHFSKKWLVKRNEEVKENGYVCSKLKEYIPKYGKILDIGCGLGDSLLAFKNSGYDVYGVEPSKHRSEIGMKIMENIVTGTAEKYLLNTPNKFDLIYFFNVLQFLEDPYKTLQMAANKISDDGKIWFKLGVYNHRTNFAHFSHLGVIRNYINLYSIVNHFESWGVYPVYYQEKPFELILSKDKNKNTDGILKQARKLNMQDIEEFAKKTLNYKRLKFFGKTKLLYSNRGVYLELKKPIRSTLPVRFIHNSDKLPIILK
jgi:SAM-dependent methyltransferase